MRHPILRAGCAEIEAEIAGGGDANAAQSYQHPTYRRLASKSLLERAVELGCADLVRLLIARGASVNYKQTENFYIDVPVRNGDRDWLLPLWMGFREEEPSGDILLFLWSLFFQNVEVCEVLHDAFVAQCEPQVQREVMFAALPFAAEIGNLDVLRFLLAAGGQPLINAEDESQQVPFAYFCLLGDANLVRFLLEQGADPDIGSPDEGYPLMDAIHRSNEEVALVLIEHGAALNIQLWNRSTPLSFAKTRKLKKVVAAIKARLKESPAVRNC
jgi:hypothetical protein